MTGSDQAAGDAEKQEQTLRKTQTRQVGHAAGGAKRSPRAQGSRASVPALRQVTTPARVTARALLLLQEAGKEMGGEK